MFTEPPVMIGAADVPPGSGPYTADYYMNGRKIGLSNYENYVWRRDATCFFCSRMMLYLRAMPGDSVLDYGCARGFYVKALRLLGYEARGFDISTWAIENCDPDVKDYVSNVLTDDPVDWIMCKDVLEHVQSAHLPGVIEVFLRRMRKGALIIVPIGSTMTGKYLAPQDNEDKTHVTCWPLDEWLHFIQAQIDRLKAPFYVTGGYRLPGLKEACDPYPGSVAFITLRKL